VTSVFSVSFCHPNCFVSVCHQPFQMILVSLVDLNLKNQVSNEKQLLFRVYRNIGDDFRSIYVGIISYTIIRIPSLNNQDSMESIRPGFLTVAHPCQVFIETPDGSGNQLQGTPLGQRQLATSSRPSFYPKHRSQIIQDILKETHIISTVDNMIR